MSNIETNVLRVTSKSIRSSFLQSNKKHLLITGKRGVGKSTLLQQLDFPLDCFIRSYAVKNEGVYISINKQPEVQIGAYNASCECAEAKMIACSDGLTIASKQLKQIVDCDEIQSVGIVEIGYLESNCQQYCDLIFQLFKKKKVIAVVRKQNLDFLNKVLKIDNSFVVDCDLPLEKVGCVVMASGLGKRFGGNKLMADFHQKPLIQSTLDKIQSVFGKQVVVTRSEEIQSLCLNQNINCIHHSFPYRSDTVRLGIHEMNEMNHVIFIQADQPLISIESLISMCYLAINNPNNIIRASYQQEIGSPVIFPKCTFTQLANLPENKGGGYVIKQNENLVIPYEVENDYELWDIDTVDDLRRLEAI